MSNARRIKLFRDDLGKVIEIPPEFELPGEDAILLKQDGKLIIVPAKNEMNPFVAPVES